jgi:hypothetical protein
MKPFRQYMAETGQQSTLDDLERNFKFGEAEAQYNSQGYYGSGPNSNQIGQQSNIPSVEDFVKAITDTLPKPPPPYSEVNPFYFDEQNAKDLATAEFSPYYDELIQDYMKDVDTTKTRLGEDKTKILSELESQKDYFMQNEGTNLDRMIRGIKEGYESKGLYFSGENQRTQGEAQSDYQSKLDDYMRQYQYKTTGYQTDYQRGLEDVTSAATKYNRDVGREKETAITGQVGQLKGEAMDEYLLGAQKYYENPNWGSMI